MKLFYTILAFLSVFASVDFSLAQTAVFNYTGTVQTFTVPACVTSISVDVLGGKAGNNGVYLGGNGGRVQATVPVTPGEVLNIYVGELGVNTSMNSPSGFNGGGGVFSYSSGGTSGTGGGASDIRRTPYQNADRLVVAGGGGGGGYVNSGGHGGGLVGQDGVPYVSWPNSGGKGGTQSAGGVAGVACCSCPTYTTAGALFQGGNGAGDGAGGGGGGGGYYGGGGSCFAGGGGGSSYTAPSVTAVTHTQGFNAAAGSVTITYVPVLIAPPGAISGPSVACVGETVSYSISLVAGANSYTWAVPSGATINAGQGTTSISVTLGSNSGDVTVIANYACGSSSPTILPITVNPLPIVGLGTDIIQCGGTALLDAQNAGSAYLWSDNSTAQTLLVSSAGTYFVAVTGVNSCTASDTIIVTIHQLPVVNLGADSSQCGGTILLNAQNAGSDYVWSDNSTAQTLIAAASGSYSVAVTDSNGCSVSDTIAVFINPIPSVNYTESQGLVCITAPPIILTPGSPVGGVYSGVGVSGNIFDPAAAGVGTHDVIYTFTDNNGCTNSDTSVIFVDPCLFTDASNLLHSISVFPNPNNGRFELHLNVSAENLRIEMLDLHGRLVYSSQEINVQRGFIKTMEIMNLAAGIYYLRLTSDTEQGVHKMMIQK